MDFETAVWEMTHLLIAPKKVFKSIYYHKRKRTSVFCGGILNIVIRDTKLMAPAGSSFYVPFIVFLTVNLLRLVLSVYPFVRIDRQTRIYVHLCTLLGRIFINIDNGIFLGWPITRTGRCRFARTKKTTRTVWTTGRNKRSWSTGVWVLFRCVNTSLLPTLCAALHFAIHSNAGNQPHESGIDVFREPPVPGGGHILEFDYISRLQRSAFLASYTVTVVANGGVVCRVACMYNTEHQLGAMGY